MSLNLMICGHGELIINEYFFIDEFMVPNLNVFTLAPPTAQCMYAPENLQALRKKMQYYNKDSINFENLISVALREEKNILGSNYCDPDWIGFFADEQSYDPTKGCGVQNKIVQDKLLNFEDANVPEGILGVWDLTRGYDSNIMIDIPLQYTIVNGEKYYKFSDIIKMCAMFVLPTNQINVLDFSCSVVFDDNNTLISDPRFQRRVQRHVVPNKKAPHKKAPHKKAGTKKRKNKKIKRQHKMKKNNTIRQQSKIYK